MGIEEFHESFAKFADDCKTCIDNCCKTDEKPIQVEPEEINVFGINGVFIYSQANGYTIPINLHLDPRLKTLPFIDKFVLKWHVWKHESDYAIDEESLLEWRETLKPVLKNEKGGKIKKALIETAVEVVGLEGHYKRMFIPYSENGFCPIYDLDNKQCSDYQNRPQICRDYPLVSYYVADNQRQTYKLARCSIIRKNKSLRRLVPKKTVK